MTTKTADPAIAADIRCAADFTKIENDAFGEALRGYIAGYREAALRYWAFRSWEEHWVSKCPSDPTAYTGAQSYVLKRIRSLADAADEDLASLIGDNNEVERVNDLIDATVLQLIAEIAQ